MRKTFYRMGFAIFTTIPSIAFVVSCDSGIEKTSNESSESLKTSETKKHGFVVKHFDEQISFSKNLDELDLRVVNFGYQYSRDNSTHRLFDGCFLVIEDPDSKQKAVVPLPEYSENYGRDWSLQDAIKYFNDNFNN